MLLIAIAGPYRAATEWGIVENIRRAEAAAITIWRLGAAVICPHKNTAFFGGLADDSVWLNGALEMVRRSDAVFALPGWEASDGARREIEQAHELSLPVFFDLQEVEQWLRSRA